ncbi:hypothetical protein BKN38_07465 [Helicobacter sp. CLO-3]|uniref:prepilin peptidase n=1 Tax=unclassified Helicobacter TaxID=2593540 RepID=UPI000805DD10|nr:MULTISPECIES: prepilin peptidase [unclassified Helicobacter]OBV29072.1 hypothetical protein BA723_07105 [Helicobacter sp. CLO-3]OHU82267.1 hypothetical protein BKN38_07465 [Helicobacter sp. CLO-3]
MEDFGIILGGLWQYVALDWLVSDIGALAILRGALGLVAGVLLIFILLLRVDKRGDLGDLDSDALESISSDSIFLDSALLDSRAQDLAESKITESKIHAAHQTQAHHTNHASHTNCQNNAKHQTHARHPNHANHARHTSHITRRQIFLWCALGGALCAFFGAFVDSWLALAWIWAFVALTIALCVWDIAYFAVPDSQNLVLLFLAFIAGFYPLIFSDAPSVQDMFAPLNAPNLLDMLATWRDILLGAGLLALVYMIGKMAFHRQVIGEADIVFCASMSGIIGFENMLLSIFWGCVCASLAVIFSKILRQKRPAKIRTNSMRAESSANAESKPSLKSSAPNQSAQSSAESKSSANKDSATLHAATPNTKDTKSTAIPFIPCVVAGLIVGIFVGALL